MTPQVLDDAAFADHVGAGVTSMMGNSGQTCSAPSRMLVPKPAWRQRSTSRGRLRRRQSNTTVGVFELFPKGQEPQMEWIHTPADEPHWRSVLLRVFSNMAAVQQGMKSLGFLGTKPNPYRERSTANLHQLARYMGTGEPREFPTKRGETLT